MNPSHEYMRRIRREEQAKLLGLRRERVVKALDSLTLHGDANVMLAQIAYAVHPHVGAWDAESCDHLRNVLVELIGSDHEAASGAQRHSPCSAGGCHRGDESKEVDGQSRTCPESEPDVSKSDDGTSVTKELREWVLRRETVEDVLMSMPPQTQRRLTYKGNRLLEMADDIDGRAEDMRMERDEYRKEMVDAYRIAATFYEGCRMYRDMLNDAAKDYKELRDRLYHVVEVCQIYTEANA